MLKNITKDEVLGLLEKGETVFMLYKIDMNHTFGDALGADGFVIEAKEKPGTECPVEEPRNEEKQKKKDPEKSKYDKAEIWRLYKQEKLNANQIAERLGGNYATVAYHIHKMEKERQ